MWDGRAAQARLNDRLDNRADAATSGEWLDRSGWAPWGWQWDTWLREGLPRVDFTPGMH